jgi:hypothetical protein
MAEAVFALRVSRQNGRGRSAAVVFHAWMTTIVGW